jgi:hypothetical protein
MNLNQKMIEETFESCHVGNEIDVVIIYEYLFSFHTELFQEI